MVGRGIHYQSLRGIMQIHQLISACLDKHTKKAFTCLVIPPLNTWDGSMSNILIWHWNVRNLLTGGNPSQFPFSSAHLMKPTKETNPIILQSDCPLWSQCPSEHQWCGITPPVPSTNSDVTRVSVTAWKLTVMALTSSSASSWEESPPAGRKKRESSITGQLALCHTSAVDNAVNVVKPLRDRRANKPSLAASLSRCLPSARSR